jgi:phosphoribosylanthranilate isomerase
VVVVEGPGPLVKVCGLTRAADAVLAASLGAWALGLVFAESPRRVEPEEARALVAEVAAGRGPAEPLPCRSAGVGVKAAAAPRIVGVFRDASPAEVAAVVVHAGLDGVQLHGQESPRDVRRLREALARRGRSPLVIKALSVAVEGDGAAGGHVAAAEAARLEERAAAFRPVADLLLVDTCVAGAAGGTGVPFPWPVARRISALGPVLVAGGLRPETAAAALRQSGAAGVDLSSGLEAAPGVKDEAAMRRLFAALGRRSKEAGDR